jgi:cell division protein FtsL
MKLSIQRYRSTDRLKNSLRKRIVSSRSVIPILFVCSLVILALIHVWQRVYVMNSVKEVRRLENENIALQDLVKTTDMEIINLSRLSRISDLAVNELGLSKTEAGDFYTLRIGQSRKEVQGFDELVVSLKKIADNFHVVSESKAATDGIFELDENR